MVSGLKLQEQRGFNIFFKVLSKFVFTKVTKKPNITLVNIFIPNGLSFLKTFLSTSLVNSNNALQKNMINMIELRRLGSILFLSLIACGKKEFLKYSFYKEIHEKYWSVGGNLWKYVLNM